MNPNLAYFLGISHDAYLICREEKYEYGLEIEQKNKKFIELLATMFEDFFAVKTSVKLRKRPWGDYYRLRLYSKKVYNKIACSDFIELLSTASKKTKQNFIRGFFDAEGSTTSGKIRFFSNDTNLLKSVSKAIGEFGIKVGKITTSHGDVFELPIYAKAEQKKFMKVFQPLHPDKQLTF